MPVRRTVRRTVQVLYEYRYVPVLMMMSTTITVELLYSYGINYLYRRATVQVHTLHTAVDSLPNVIKAWRNKFFGQGLKSQRCFNLTVYLDSSIYCTNTYGNHYVYTVVFGF